MSNLLSAYRHYRANKAKAIDAIAWARRDVAEGKTRHASSPWCKPCVNPVRDGKQWLEKPDMRFVGYADEFARIEHRGWYVDNNQCETIRGVVYQLPGRNGKARFVAGHNDTWNDDAAYIDWSTVYESDFEGEMRDALRTMGKAYHTPERLKPGYWAEAAHETARKEAARAADEFARIESEHMREYDSAYQAGARYADLGDEIAGSRDTIKRLLAERKAARAAGLSGFDEICATIRRVVSNALGDIQEAREMRQKLRDGDYINEWLPGFYSGDARLVAAFNDGAGI